MPELPEVETIVRGLDTPLRGRRIVKARLSPATMYRRGSLPVGWLRERVLTQVERVGKNAVFRFGPRALMTVNLGMTGRLILCESGDEETRRPGKHLHGRFVLEGGGELRFYDPRRFGYVYVADGCDFLEELNIGPDALAVRAAYLRGALEKRSAPVKSLLLIQRIVSGLGNIYIDELLFDAGVDPRTPGTRAAAKSKEILASARRILNRAIAGGGSTIRDYRRHDGTAGGFQQRHAVYGRKGKPCIECGAAIEKIVLGARGTHFCPMCQTDDGK